MKTPLAFILILIFIADAYAQYIPTGERGDVTYRRQSLVDGGNIRVTIHNYLVNGAVENIMDQYRFEWPMGSRHQYLYFIQQWIGAEVIGENGDTLNIVSVPQFRTAIDNPDIRWTFQPVPGYNNPGFSGIASSTESESWPTAAQGGWPDRQDDVQDPGWVGSWNSMWGKNNFLAKQEFYYHTSDDKYYYPDLYTPDTTDPARGGLGLIISQRIFVLDFLGDEVFFVADIYNSGTRDIEKAVSSLWVADLIGGNSQDDYAVLDTAREIIYFADADRWEVNNWYTDFPALFFLETPVHNTLNNPFQTGLSGAVRFPAGSISDWNNDRQLFNQYMSPGVFDLNTYAGEYDLWLTNGYFNLPAGKSQRLAYVVTFGNEISDIEAKYDMIHTVYDAISSGSQTLPLTLNNPGIEEEINGSYDITWNALDNATDVQISILHSRDNGQNWQMIANKVENNGHYLWNTTQVPDGILNRLKILAWNKNQFNIADTKSIFTINNTGDAFPQISLVNPVDRQVLTGTDTIKWFSGDADGDPSYVTLHYKNNVNGISGIIEDSINNNMYVWDTWLFANSTNYNIYATVFDGQYQDTDSITGIVLYNERQELSESYHIYRNTIGTGTIKVNVFDESSLKNRNYRLRFREKNDRLVYDVMDDNSNDSLVIAASGIHGMEGPAFDGIRLYIQSDTTQLIPELSGWNNPDVYNYDFGPASFFELLGPQEASDYQIIFDDNHIDTSVEYVFVGGGTSYPASSVPVNFRIHNLTLGNEYASFAFVELDGTDGHLSVDPFNNDYSDVVYFLKTENDTLIPAWQLQLNITTGSRNPQLGDTLSLTTLKAFQPGDSYYFGIDPTTVDNPVAGPKNFRLSTNFPNPFNLSTKFKLYLPQNSPAKADIYDILGRRIRRLLNKKLQAGNHIISWDGKTNAITEAASGIYFLHFQTSTCNAVRKMLLIK